MPYPIEPSLVVEANHIDNEGIALPFANRVSHPQWRIQELVMWTPIRVDMAHEASIFEHHDHFVRKLDDFHWSAVKINSWHTRRKTAVNGIVRIPGWFFVRPKHGFGGLIFGFCPRSH